MVEEIIACDKNFDWIRVGDTVIHKGVRYTADDIIDRRNVVVLSNGEKIAGIYLEVV